MTRDTLEEIIGIALEFFLVASFLVFVVMFNSTKKDFAEVKNNKLEMANQIVQYREFCKYETGYSDVSDRDNYMKECLYADDVVEAIRNYKNGDIEIYVDKPNDSNNPIHLTKETSEFSPSLYSYATLTSSRNGIDPNAIFHPYLIYNGFDVTNPSYYNNNCSGTVTGIAFIRFNN